MFNFPSCLQASMLFYRRILRAPFVCFVAMVVLGCGRAQVAEPLTGSLAGNDPQSQLDFWHTLAERRVTSNDEAFHGLLLFLDGEDPAADYAERMRALKDRGLLAASFDRPAHEGVQRGTLAVALVKALRIRGGTVMSLFGATPRYATRELVSMNLYPPSSPHQTFRGDEFLFVMGRVEDYQRRADYRAPAKQLDE